MRRLFKTTVNDVSTSNIMDIGGSVQGAVELTISL
jgi:hypothetical protein